MDRFAVVGLGRFGSRLATSLAAAGAEVIAMDRDREVVEEIRDRVTLAIAMDATDEQALRMQGVDRVDTAVVGIGHNFEANALTTALFKSIRVKRVISRAANSMQARILTRIGADAVVSPEDESADRWSHRLLSPFMIDHVELGEGYALVQMAVPGEWREKTLADLSLRASYNVTVVAIKRRVESSSPTGVDTSDRRVVDLPMPSSKLGADDTIILAGFDHDLERLPGG